MYRKLKDRLLALVMVFSIIATLCGAVPVKAEETHQNMPRELGNVLGKRSYDRNNLKLTTLESSKDADDLTVKIEMQDENTDKIHLWIRKDAELLNSKDWTEEKENETDNYKKYIASVKNNKDSLLHIKSKPADDKENPFFIVADATTYNLMEDKKLLAEEKETDKNKEDSEMTVEEVEFKEDQKNDAQEEKIKEKPLMLFKQSEQKTLKERNVKHTLKIHKVDKTSKKPMKGVAFKAELPSGKKVEGETDKKGDLNLELSIGTWKLTETTPEGYKEHCPYLIEVKEGEMIIHEMDAHADTKEIKKQKSESVKKSASVAPIEKITEYQFYCRLTGKDNTGDKTDKNNLWVTSGDSIQCNIKFKLKDTAKAGDTFQIKFDEKINPGSLTVPYYAPNIFLDGISAPAAVSSYDSASNTITYTLTSVINDRTNVNMYLNLGTIGPRAEHENLKPNAWNDFTNTITGVEGGDFEKKNRIFVDYGSTDSQIRFKSNNNWFTGFFSQVDRHGNPVYVDAVFYVNIMPGNRANWRGYTWYERKRLYNNTVLLSHNESLGDVEDIRVYQIPDAEKNTLMKRSFPDPSKIAGLNKKDITENCSIDNDSVQLPEKRHSKNGYIIKVRYPLKNQVSGSGEKKPEITGIWRPSNKKHGISLSQIKQYAGGNAGNVEKALTVENEKANPDIEFKKVDEKGNPLSGAEFELRVEGEQTVPENRKSISNQNGEISFKEVPDGRYSLWETKASSDIYMLPQDAVMEIEVSDGKLYKITRDIDGNEEKSLLTGDDKKIVNMSKGKVKLIINKVDDETQAPLQGAEFKLLDENRHVVAVVETNAQGRAEIKDLNYGTYTLWETKAPTGYTCDDNGQTIEVKKDNSFKAPDTFQTDVSNQINLLSSDLTIDAPYGNERENNTIYPNKGDRMKISNTYAVKEGTKKIQQGDYFYLMLSNNINPYGILPVEESNLDIESPFGKLAEGQYKDIKGIRYILYKFTDCVEKINIKNFSTNVTYYVDPMRVKKNGNVDISQSIEYKDKKTFSVYADFSGTERRQAVNGYGAMDLCTKITHVDSNKKRLSYYLYLNRNSYLQTQASHNLHITGNNVDLSKAEVTIFRPINTSEKKNKMPESFGIDDNSLGNFYQRPAINDENVINFVKKDSAVNIDFGNIFYEEYYQTEKKTGSEYLQDGYGYVVKVDCPITEKSLSAKSFTKYETKYKYVPDSTCTWVSRYDEVYMTDNTSSMDGEIIVNKTNTKNYVEFEKKDISREPLKGALFDLYKGEECILKDLPTDLDGKIKFDMLAPGKYSLKEVKAPEGYRIPRGVAATFTVTERGKITDVKALDGEGNLLQNSHTIINKKGYYPSTGGKGMLIYLLAGMMLMSTAFVFIKKKL